MTALDDALQEDVLPRIMLLGYERTKKTWWAGTAAEAFFSTVVIDGEDGFQTLRKINAEARKRINVIHAHDQTKTPQMCMFMTFLLRGDRFFWDNTLRQRCFQEVHIVPDHDYTLVDASALNKNCVLVVDSWKTYSWSVAWRYCLENGIDLSEAEEAANRQEHYRYSGNLLNWAIQQLKSLPCHIVVICHKTVYEKMKQERRGNKIIRTPEWQRVIPVSSSGPHGVQLGTHFSDILQFRLKALENIEISTQSLPDETSGSRIIPPGTYDWIDLPYWKMCEHAGIKLPEKNNLYEPFPNMKGSEIGSFRDWNVSEGLAMPKGPIVIEPRNTDTSSSLGNLLGKSKPKET